jgi:hypothetical protein
MTLRSRELGRRGLRLLAALCAATLLGPGASPARPKKGTLAVQLRKMGSGPRATTVRTVQIVDASTGEVLMGVPVGAPGRTTLRPPAGVYFAVASLARPQGTRVGTSRVFRFDPTKRLSLNIPLRRAPVEPVRPNPQHAARPRAAAGSPVGTMGSVTVTVGGSVSNVTGPLFTPLFNETSDSFTWVDTSTGFIIARAKELALQADGRTDASTHISDNLIPPDFVVDGDLTIEGNHVTGEIVVVDANTGEVIARIPVDTTIDNWADFLNELAKEIARRLRERLTTTTTTTTTTSSSTSTSTSSTTAPSTPGTTSTTGSVPTTTTTSSTTTTTTTSSTTTTTAPPGCTSDDDCPTCQCCSLGQCVGATGSGAVQCCNFPGEPPTMIQPACGSKTPNPCPPEAVCPPPGQLLGGSYYFCHSCVATNNIIEVVVPSGTVPPISQPSNACTRR